VSNVPPLLSGLVDDAAVFPPGNAPLPEAVTAHRAYRAAWYAPLVGPLLLPAEDALNLRETEPLEVGLIAGQPALERVTEELPATIIVRQWESPMAKRGEDPLPGLKAFIALLEGRSFPGYAEIPLTWGLMSALDHLADARAAGAAVAPKFRTGGLAAELFPTPMELAAVLCACRDRGLPFKLTAGLHQAVRHTDPDTALVHHGYLNVLVAALAAADGGEPVDLAEILGCTDVVPLVGAVVGRLDEQRPLWIGFGSCSIPEPLGDVMSLGLVTA
jgi:hypothetical protein